MKTVGDEPFVQVRLRDLYDALVWCDHDAKQRLKALAIAEHDGQLHNKQY